jgi:hypothetical protein
MILLTAARWVITHVHNFIHNDKWAKPAVEIAGLVLAVFLGIAIHRYFVPVVHTTTTQVTHDIQTVTVDKPILTEKTLTKILSDPKDQALIKQLLAENAALKVNVTQLTQTLGTLNQSGSGPILVELPPADKPNDPIQYHFKDWHLDFRTDTKTATYELSQRFEALTTTGRNKAGLPVSTVKLYELGANQERIPVTGLQTIGIFADETTPHWLLHLNVQGGIAATRDKTGAFAPGGVIVLQWLKHGRTKSAEDITFAVLSPTVFMDKNTQDIGLLPFSFNLGRIPKQPFTNLWLSPFISKSQRLGVTLTATF